ncbi:hypothetical protein BDV95DRAFT_601702 [Massariosphaeria phaeospora]|uniref:Protein kinase domain-containing protein n=1 Tax=Massariosphaeria phaeospora TaxID=100035 RepID=A0A7C8IIK4_9PLEO|nr:hypothetical protein BDV95DRAFT_601702 [Massariosphaeria phaeospora]
MPPIPQIPASLHAIYQPLALLGTGAESTILLSRRRGTPTPAQPIALKIIHPSHRGIITSALLATLTAIQHHAAHPLVQIREHDGSGGGVAWVAMDMVGGRSVEQLLDENYNYNGLVFAEAGLPPWLVAHVFAEVCRAETYLREHGLMHVDLKAGGNVMLSFSVNTSPNLDTNLNTSAAALPTVTLIDFGGLKLYHPTRAWKICEHVLCLFSTAVRGQRRVPDVWRAGIHHTMLQKLDALYASVEGYVRLGEGERRGEEWTIERVLGGWGVVVEGVIKEGRRGMEGMEMKEVGEGVEEAGERVEEMEEMEVEVLRFE